MITNLGIMEPSRVYRRPPMSADPEKMGEGSILLDFLRPVRMDPSQHRAGQETWACAWSPDGFYFAWSSGLKSVLLLPWNKYKHRMLDRDTYDLEDKVIPLPTIGLKASSFVWGLAFSGVAASSSQVELTEPPSQLLLAVGTETGSIEVWHILPTTGAGTANLVLTISRHATLTRDLKFAPDGKMQLLSASRDGTMRLWDLKDWHQGFAAQLKICKKRPNANNLWYFSCDWSPDGYMICGVGSLLGRGIIMLWNIKSDEFKELPQPSDVATCCSFSHDGALLATCSYDGNISLWDPHQCSLLQVISPGYSSGQIGVQSVSMSRDGRHLAVVIDESYMRMYDLYDLDTAHQHTAAPMGSICSSFSPSGTVLAIGTRYGAVTFWLAPSQVASLQHLCRLSLRTVFPSTIITERQDIPSKIKDYLLYSHLRPDKYKESSDKSSDEVSIITHVHHHGQDNLTNTFDNGTGTEVDILPL